MNDLIIRHGHVIDPANQVDGVRDVFVCDGKIAVEPVPGAQVVDAKGLVVTPGLIDMHVHLREPGRTDKETIESGTRGAARGGFTSVVCMPNTSPAADNAGTIALIKQRAAAVGVVNVFPAGAITKNIEGKELAPIGSLKRAGIVAITDDGHCVQNNELMRRATEYAKMFNLPVLDHCEDTNLTADGVAHEGYWNTVLGLQGWPSAGEEVMIARDVVLTELADWHIHCQHISGAGSVRLVREAKRRGLNISSEASPHHFTLTDECLKGYDTNFKMNPPLRTQRDADALIEGLADGTIDAIASDHAPHCAYEKEVEFDKAPFGIIGLETALALSLALVHRKALTMAQLVEKFTTGPARLLRLSKGTLSVGADADITLINLAREWIYDVGQTASLSRNTPFHGWKLKGKAVMTIVGGCVVWQGE